MSLSAAAPTAATRREERKVLAGTLVGTTIEWYDFFIYAQAAGLVLGPLFFAPLGETGAQLASWASIGISFLFRPLGAFLAGHFGDRLGRRPMLVITLLLMGAATTLVGALPTYEQIGILAPILLMLLTLLTLLMLLILLRHLGLSWLMSIPVLMTCLRSSTSPDATAVARSPSRQ